MYCCAAHPTTGVDLLAAKVYHPYRTRATKNDALYREGRDIRDERGRVLRGKRQRRAVRKSAWGRQLQIASWIEHEYETLCLLHDIDVYRNPSAFYLFHRDVDRLCRYF